MPIDTIERAIKRGTGELEGVTYESITYEGYAPGGVALLIDVLTDNRNRTGAEVRNVFSQVGRARWPSRARCRGSSAARGVVLVATDASEDDVMLAALDAGAEDIVDEGDAWRLTCEPQAVEEVREALEAAGITVAVGREHDGLVDHHRVSPSAEEAKKVLRIIDALEEHDDVQDVYSNFDIPDDILQTVEA